MTRIKLLSFVLLFSVFSAFTPHAYAAGIAFDSSGRDSTGSFSFTNTAGNFMVVSIIKSLSTNTSCTYNGVSLTHVVTTQWGGGASNWLEIQTLVSPATGAHTLACSGGGYIAEQVITYSGVNTSGQPDWYHGVSQGSATTYSQTTGEAGGTGTVTGTNDWAIFATCSSAGEPTGSSNWTERQADFNGCQIGDSNAVIGNVSFTQSNTLVSASAGISTQLTLAPAATAAVVANWGSLILLGDWSF